MAKNNTPSVIEHLSAHAEKRMADSSNTADGTAEVRERAARYIARAELSPNLAAASAYVLECAESGETPDEQLVELLIRQSMPGLPAEAVGSALSALSAVHRARASVAGHGSISDAPRPVASQRDMPLHIALGVDVSHLPIVPGTSEPVVSAKETVAVRRYVMSAAEAGAPIDEKVLESFVRRSFPSLQLTAVNDAVAGFLELYMVTRSLAVDARPPTLLDKAIARLVPPGPDEASRFDRLEMSLAKARERWSDQEQGRKRGRPSTGADSATVRTKSDGTVVKRLTVNLPLDLAQRLSEASARQGVSVGQLIEVASRMLLGEADDVGGQQTPAASVKNKS